MHKQIRTSFGLGLVLMIFNILGAAAQVWPQEKVIEYCNVALTNAYLTGLKDANSVNGYKDIKDKLALNSIDSPSPFEALKALRTKNFEITFDKLSTPFHNIGLQSVSETSGEVAAEQIIAAIEGAILPLINKTSNHDQKLKDIRKEVVDFVATHIPKENKSSGTSDSEQRDPKSVSNNVLSNGDPIQLEIWSNASWWVILIALTPYILFATLLAFGVNRYKSLAGRIDKRKQDLVGLKEDLRQQLGKIHGNTSGFGQSNAIDELKKQVLIIIENSETVKRLHEEITGLSERINKIEKSADNIFPSKSSIGSSPINTPDPVKKGATVFYMSYPVGNCFSLNARSESAENTIYRFLPRQNNSEANFEIHTTGGTPVSDIISSTEQFIKPACIEENLPGANTRNIRTVKQGFAVLEGDRWVVKEKAHISYE